jgi:hypothetical protein
MERKGILFCIVEANPNSYDLFLIPLLLHPSDLSCVCIVEANANSYDPFLIPITFAAFISLVRRKKALPICASGIDKPESNGEIIDTEAVSGKPLAHSPIPGLSRMT